MRDSDHVYRAESGKGLGQLNTCGVEKWRGQPESQGQQGPKEHSKILRDHGCWGNKKQGGDSILLDHLYGGDWCPDFIQAQQGDSVTSLWGGGLKLELFLGLILGFLFPLQAFLTSCIF